MPRLISLSTPPKMASRRRFLQLAGGALTFAASPVLADFTEYRSLSFVHAETGETLDAPYYQHGIYHPTTLARVAFLSGYRSPLTNEQLRQSNHVVAEHSMHVQGKAVDIRASGVPTKKLRDLAVAMNRGGVGYYPAAKSLHLDTGRLRTW
jgi:uncharacterized protein YcbK (DUF882 family)